MPEGKIKISRGVKMIEEMLSAWFAWQKWCGMKKNGNQERREEELEEEIESDQEEDFEHEK